MSNQVSHAFHSFPRNFLILHNKIKMFLYEIACRFTNDFQTLGYGKLCLDILQEQFFIHPFNEADSKFAYSIISTI